MSVNQVVVIPDNYTEGKLYLTGGRLSVNTIFETLVIVGIACGLEMLLLPSFLGVFKIGLIVITAITLGYFTIAGVDGLTMSEFLLWFISYLNNRETLSFRAIKKRVRPEKKAQKKEKERKKGWLEKKIEQWEEKNPNHEKIEEDEDSENQKSTPFNIKKLSKELITLNDFSLPYTQKIVPIEEIKNGIIKTKDNRYVKILEIQPTSNYDMMSEQDSTLVLLGFQGLNRVGPVKMQWKIQPIKADNSQFITSLREKFNAQNEKNAMLNRLANELVDLVDYKAQVSSVEYKYYLIISYDSTLGVGNELKKNVYNVLQNYVDDIEAQVINMSCEIVKHENENLFLYDIFYKLFNRTSSVKEPLEDRYTRVVTDTIRAKGLQVTNSDEIPQCKPHNIVAPRGIDFRHLSYMVMDGMYYSFITFTNYPVRVRVGWLAEYINASYGFDYDIHIHREDPDKLVDKLNNRISTLQAGTNYMNENQKSTSQVLNSIDSAMYLKDCIEKYDMDVFYFTIIISCYAPTYAGMIANQRQMLKVLHRQGYEAKVVKYKIKETFLSTLPLNYCDKQIFKKYRRNVATDGLTSLYTMTTMSLKDYDGIYLGENLENRSPFFWDPFNTTKYTSSSGFILGMTGYGKSYTTMSMSLNMRLTGIQTFVIAPAKAHEYKPLCDAVGGQFITISGNAVNGKQTYLNIMEIRPTNMIDRNVVDDITVSMGTNACVSNKIQALLPFFKLMCPDIKQSQSSQLDSILMNIYRDYGITNDDPNSIYIDNDPQKPLKKMPVLGDVYEVLRNHEDPSMKAIAGSMTQFINGSMDFFNKQTNVSLDKKFCVIDISQISGDAFKFALYLAQDYVWSWIKEGTSTKKAIVFDEMWKMLEIPESFTLIREVYKTIRGYRGMALGVTQGMDDIINQEGGKEIVNNAAFRILHHLEHQALKTAEEVCMLNQEEVNFLEKADRGMALVSIKNEKYPIHIETTPTASKLFATGV